MAVYYIEVSNDLFVDTYVQYKPAGSSYSTFTQPKKAHRNGDRDWVCRLGSSGSLNWVDNINLDLSDAEGSRQFLEA